MICDWYHGSISRFSAGGSWQGLRAVYLIAEVWGVGALVSPAVGGGSYLCNDVFVCVCLLVCVTGVGKCY